jgi:hypothetical protein
MEKARYAQNPLYQDSTILTGEAWTTSKAKMKTMKVSRMAKIKESGITFSMAKCHFSAVFRMKFLMASFPLSD